MSRVQRWEIRGGDYRATVLEAGGGLGDVWAGDLRIVHGPDPDHAVSAGRGQVLIPWPNRIRDGRYTFAGHEQQLALTEPALHNASQGLVRWSAWQLLDRTPDRVEVGVRLMPQPGYPWPLDVRAGYRAAADGLRITLAARNLGSTPAPFAAGMHPYLDVGVPLDEARLHLPAARHVRVDDRLLPLEVEATPQDLDFGTARSLRRVHLDDAFGELRRTPDGTAIVRLTGAHTVELKTDASWRWIQAFTGDELPEAARESLAVEPMTAPADAFNSGIDLQVLAPGASWSGSFSIALGSPDRP